MPRRPLTARRAADGGSIAKLLRKLAHGLGAALQRREGQMHPPAGDVDHRRFADEFSDKPVGRLAAGDSGLLAIRSDLAPNPWHARVVPEARLTACGR